MRIATGTLDLTSLDPKFVFIYICLGRDSAELHFVPDMHNRVCNGLPSCPLDVSMRNIFSQNFIRFFFVFDVA